MAFEYSLQNKTFMSVMFAINKLGQRTMKTAIKIFWPFHCFKIEGKKHLMLGTARTKVT